VSPFPTDLRANVAVLLASAGIRAPILSIEPCLSGGNNRTYQVRTSAGTFLTKQYFRDERDTRDRLAAEHAFLSYAAAVSPDATPVPYASDQRTGMALHEFIDGTLLRAGEVRWEHVQAALDFVTALNSPLARVRAPTLPSAAEACFSLAQHLALVSERMQRLNDAPTSGKEDREARDFFRTLSSYWGTLTSRFARAAAGRGLELDETLETAQRCISPSDFGFHNALVAPNGRIRFIDFEYAGWDDPAKTAGDFFSQLALPVPGVLFHAFVNQLMACFARPHELVARANLLRPVYVVKWCCIALNVFLPEHLARRRFANPSLDETTLKCEQLTKAQVLFETLQHIA